ncbi:MarC family protein [Xanthobacter sp. V4C-4]|uniref:MarC family protein n=1 Tax=Xanthobacter cornucopiae TaxID=3119924 RepID=UPI003727BF89
MISFLNVFVAVYAALFPIVNPLGAAPIFLNFVRHCSPATRERVARKVAIYGFLLLFFSMLIGAKVLLFFGVTLPVLRVAGGLVVAAVGWRLLNQDDPPPAERAGGAAGDDAAALEQAFYPLTLPLTVGPGTIATAIALSTGPAAVVDQDFAVLAMPFMEEVAGAVAGLAAIALSVYFAFREAAVIERVIGRTGTSVLVRLFAFILLAIGLQIIWLGLHELIGELAATPA